MRQKGFTLTEMLVTLTVLVIILAIGVPSFNSFLSSSNMISNSNSLISSLNYARMEAMKRGDSVYMGQQTANSWTGGLVVWVDNNSDGAYTAGEELRLWEAFESNVSVSAINGQTSFVFSASGEANSADALTICDDRTGEQGMEVSVLLSGAVISEKVTCG